MEPQTSSRAQRIAVVSEQIRIKSELLKDKLKGDAPIGNTRDNQTISNGYKNENIW